MARKTRAEKHEIILRKLESSARWRDEMGYDSVWTAEAYGNDSVTTAT